MKKSFNFIKGYLLVVLLAAITLTFCCSCDNLGIKNTEVIDKEYADSIIAESIQNYTNPLFTNVDEVLQFRTMSIEQKSIDSAFEEMPETILKNVASVCLRRDGYVSKRLIIYEYQANKQVYDNLPANSEPQCGVTEDIPTKDQKGTSSGGEPNRPDSASKSDTVINGKTYRAL